VRSFAVSDIAGAGVPRFRSDTHARASHTCGSSSKLDGRGSRSTPPRAPTSRRSAAGPLGRPGSSRSHVAPSDPAARHRRNFTENLPM